jgi:hypothetical protein
MMRTSVLMTRDDLPNAEVPKLFWVTATLVPNTHPQCPLPYPVKSILQNSGLHNPLRNIIKIK